MDGPAHRHRRHAHGALEMARLHPVHHHLVIQRRRAFLRPDLQEPRTYPPRARQPRQPPRQNRRRGVLPVQGGASLPAGLFLRLGLQGLRRRSVHRPLPHARRLRLCTHPESGGDRPHNQGHGRRADRPSPGLVGQPDLGHGTDRPRGRIRPQGTYLPGMGILRECREMLEEGPRTRRRGL